MKKLLVVLFLLINFGVIAQKVAYVDSDYILSNIPSFKAAQEKVDQIAFEWQKELEAQKTELTEMIKGYQAEKVLLTEKMKTQKEQEIIEKERNLTELQRKYFGPEGELFKKRKELIQPIQEEVFAAVKEIADEENIAIIFDSASGANILFADPKYDKSELVLEKLGYKK